MYYVSENMLDLKYTEISKIDMIYHYLWAQSIQKVERK